MARLPHSNQPRAATAYPNSRTFDSAGIKKILLILCMVFILRNILFKDYRTEQIDYFKERGVKQEEIEKYVPKTFEEKRASLKEKKSEYEQLKDDVKFLKEEVNRLKNQIEDMNTIYQDAFHTEESKEVDDVQHPTNSKSLKNIYNISEDPDIVFPGIIDEHGEDVEDSNNLRKNGAKSYSHSLEVEENGEETITRLSVAEEAEEVSS